MANIRYSGLNTYLSSPWESSYGITPVEIFDPINNKIIRIDPPENSPLDIITY